MFSGENTAHCSLGHLAASLLLGNRDIFLLLSNNVLVYMASCVSGFLYIISGNVFSVKIMLLYFHKLDVISTFFLKTDVNLCVYRCLVQNCIGLTLFCMPWQQTDMPVNCIILVTNSL